MEITVKKKDCIAALDKISSVISSKPSLAILSGILLEAKDDGVYLTATDLENTIRTSVEAKVIRKGTVLLPGKKVTSLVKQLEGDEVKFTAKENQVVIQAQESNYTFLAMNAEEFPKVPKVSSDITVKLPAPILRSTVQRISFCIHPDEPRPHFRGGLFEIIGGTWYFVATDTKRLALVKKGIEDGGKEKVRCLMPYRLLAFLPDILGDGEVELGIGKNQAYFKMDNLFLISQLLEGSNEFPDYQKVIPAQDKLKNIKLQKELFQATLRRISLFTTERYNKVKFGIGKGRLILSVASPEVGEAQEKIVIDYDGEEQNIAFNPDYLMEFLQRIDDPTVLFGFTNEVKPVLLRGEKDPDYLYVAMPLKLD